MNAADCSDNINRLIGQNLPFAVYRIPGGNELHFIKGTPDSVATFDSVKMLNGKSGFVIAPFRVSKSCPIAFIETDEETGIEMPDITEGSQTTKTVYEQPSPEYVSAFEVFTRSLSDKKFDKLVLSRRTVIKRDPDFSPATVFLKACKRYIRSYVYLCHTPQTGTWTGSTPEILLSGKRNEWHTVALAGTQSLVNGDLPDTWDEKNREEQRLVADYIRNRLHSFRIHPKEEGPYTVRAGELAHLRSDFRFSLPENNRLGNVLDLLHPTPAVCGLPKEKAFQFISDNEKYDRRYYSGFIGQLNPEGKSDLYVNLRCMEIDDRCLTLYAGGGLLASSVLEEEWKETEEKLSTMQRIIH
ncbi:MAG: isochorismate synthase [Candidatus Azobacteroides sp.]|nr:isochorismate synthase [Candidatus Azobacteroides sp.]